MRYHWCHNSAGGQPYLSGIVQTYVDVYYPRSEQIANFSVLATLTLPSCSDSVWNMVQKVPQIPSFVDVDQTYDMFGMFAVCFPWKYEYAAEVCLQ